MLVAAAAMGIATLMGQASLPIIYGATALIAGMVAFDQPARRAMMVALVPPVMVALVPPERIGDVGRVNVILFTVTSVLGPAIAGAALAQFGPGIAYLLNGLSFLPVVLVLFFVHPRPSDTPASRPSFGAMVEGLRFVWGQPVLRATMLLDFLATFFSSALTLLPVYATDVLQVDELGYGILFAAPAIGASPGDWSGDWFGCNGADRFTVKAAGPSDVVGGWRLRCGDGALRVFLGFCALDAGAGPDRFDGCDQHRHQVTHA